MLNTPQSMREFFDKEGYLVIPDAVPKGLCTEVVNAFEFEVKPDTKSLFERHASGTLEPHVFTEAGFMKYPIMNIQDLRSDRYRQFRETGLSILTHNKVKAIMTIMFGEPGKMIHTMYFDGNQVTWPHRDGHYIDSVKSGTMIGVWVALEDIHEGAGRFYVYPKSHRVTMPMEEMGQEFDPNSKEYKDGVKQYLAMSSLVCTAPALRRGDMIMWSSKTIHGSLETTEIQYSRRSLTAHYIPESNEFVGLQNVRVKKKTRIVNGVRVTLRKDQTNLGTQIIYHLLHRFPSVKTMLRNFRNIIRQIGR